MSAATLLIRADASTAIGTGHVMRCLALAQAWQDTGGRVVFAMAETTGAITARLLGESCEVTSLRVVAGSGDDARQTASFAAQHNWPWVVVDGYRFDAEYQRRLKAAGLRILFLDDYGHAEHYAADVVLNHNLCAEDALYAHREPYTRLLLGARYCLLRREFSSWRNWKREIPEAASKLLVTIGGSDPDNVTSLVVQALEQVHVANLDAVIVIGGSNPHKESVEEAAGRSRNQVRVVTDAANMAELMAWADIAISGAGSTVWEICALGLPAILICVAENQRASAEFLATKISLRLFDAGSGMKTTDIAAAIEDLASQASLRERICRDARQLVDCNGAERVVAEIIGN